MRSRRARSRLVALSTIAVLAWLLATVTSVADAAPVIAVSPSTGLADGQTVTITGSGFRSLSTIYVATCPAAATQPFDCDIGTYSTATSDESGAVTLMLAVHRLVTSGNLASPSSPIDCALVACNIGATDDPFTGTLAGNPLVPVTFSVAHLQIAFEPGTTLDPDTNEVFTRAAVTCDVPTPLSARATFSQGGADRVAGIVQERCERGAPTELFLAGYRVTGEPAYTLGPVDLTLVVAPFDAFPVPPGPDAVTASTVLDVLDGGAFRAALLPLLADPNNELLRQQLMTAIRIRVRQDPTFAAAFAAALRAAG